MGMSTKATYGAGSLSETAPGSGVWRYRWHENGKRMRATFGSKAGPLTASKRSGPSGTVSRRQLRPVQLSPVAGRSEPCSMSG
jgi:hypothetical protein